MFRAMSLPKYLLMATLLVIQQADTRAQQSAPAKQPAAKVERAIEPAIEPTLVITKAGYFLLTQDANGVPSLTPVKNVIRLGGPVPGDPVDPTNPPAEVLRTAVKSATSAVTDANKANTIKALTKLYADVAGLQGVETVEHLKMTIELIFNALKGPPANLGQQWVDWKVKTDAALASFAGGDVEKYRSGLLIVSQALEAN